MKIYGLLFLGITLWSPCTWRPLPWFMSDFPSQTAVWILNHFSNLQNITLTLFASPAIANRLSVGFSTLPPSFVLTCHQINWKSVKQTSWSARSGGWKDWGEKINFKSIFAILQHDELHVKTALEATFSSDRIQGGKFSSVAWRNGFLARLAINSPSN